MHLGRFEGFIGVDFWTALFVLLNTLAIFFVARKFLFAPVHKLISDRQKEIDDSYAGAEKARADAEALKSEYESKLAQAQTASEQILSDAQKRARAREEEILKSARAEAGALLDKAVADIELEKRKAVSEAEHEISSLALALAEKVLEREITDADREALTDRFIDGLGERK